jgi:hypothetical protein
MFKVNKDLILHLNHYPINGVKDHLNIVGHIHSLWKVQRNMINVFAGELDCNMVYAKKDKEVFISGEKITSNLKTCYNC